MATNMDTPNTNERGWREQLMDNFAVMFARATREPEEGTEWVEKMEDFITHLLEEARVNTAIEVQEGWTEELKKNFEAGATARDKELKKKIEGMLGFDHCVKHAKTDYLCTLCVEYATRNIVIREIFYLITNSKE